MPVKLINPNGQIHDFAHKMSWGHNIEDCGSEIRIQFKDLSVFEYTWQVFHFFPIRAGDYIIRNMNSGKIGLYEVIKLLGDDFSPSNHDLYTCVVRLCGYYDKEKNIKQIISGYGIFPESKITKVKNFLLGKE
jgi:hypothetical protein